MLWNYLPAEVGHSVSILSEREEASLMNIDGVSEET